MQLSSLEQRVLGSLIEKQVTTPEQYPMSLNGLANACNQKSNREPVMELSQHEVLDTLNALQQKRLVTCDEALSGRVDKYSQRFCNSDFGHLKVNEQQRALICLLLLRGPQTPGELRTRSGRLAEFNSVADVEQALTELQQLEYVTKLEREPGKRESRYQHLFSGNIATSPQPDEIAQPSAESELAGLNREIELLKQELATIKQHLGL
ncbi:MULTISPECIES: YceH family protein [unclassified Pseudoalteromonas]|uniref:YceH family protein n=1 Tax=unclassified Pseudoalteromonas TaxID=194690 RepID=UPI0030150380